MLQTICSKQFGYKYAPNNSDIFENILYFRKYPLFSKISYFRKYPRIRGSRCWCRRKRCAPLGDVVPGVRLTDTASRVSTGEGFGARHHSMRIAAEIVWRPGLPTTRWVFGGRGGGGFGAPSGARCRSVRGEARELSHAPAKMQTVGQAPGRSEVAYPRG